MDETITEKTYPIQNSWIYKDLAVLLVFVPVYIGFVLFLIPNNSFVLWFGLSVYVIFFFVGFIVRTLQVSHFHYSLQDHYIELHQGVISKENRNVPYGRIQGVFTYQGLFEKMFGLASVTFEDFSQGGVSPMGIDGYVGSGKSRYEVLGFLGNKIHIPGLKKEDAEALRELLLQKIKDNPIEDNHSGL